MKKVKTLIFDIETAPIIAATWSLFQDSIHHDAIIQDWYVICACWKWAGEKKVHIAKTYNENDKNVILKMKKAIEQADEVVAHNGKKFDLKKLQARALMNNIEPIVAPVVIDTLIQARKHFALTSNRLDAVCKQLGIPAKTGTSLKLWMDVLKGKKKAVNDMAKYCANDVLILEKLYDILKPYMDVGYNRAFDLDEEGCPKCGGNFYHKHSVQVTKTASYQRYRCNDCGSVFRGSENLMKGKKVMR